MPVLTAATRVERIPEDQRAEALFRLVQAIPDDDPDVDGFLLGALRILARTAGVRARARWISQDELRARTGQPPAPRPTLDEIDDQFSAGLGYLPESHAAMRRDVEASRQLPPTPTPGPGVDLADALAEAFATAETRG